MPTLEWTRQKGHFTHTNIHTRTHALSACGLISFYPPLGLRSPVTLNTEWGSPWPRLLLLVPLLPPNQWNCPQTSLEFRLWVASLGRGLQCLASGWCLPGEVGMHRRAGEQASLGFCGNLTETTGVLPPWVLLSKWSVHGDVSLSRWCIKGLFSLSQNSPQFPVKHLWSA